MARLIWGWSEMNRENMFSCNQNYSIFRSKLYLNNRSTQCNYFWQWGHDKIPSYWIVRVTFSGIDKQHVLFPIFFSSLSLSFSLCLILAEPYSCLTFRCHFSPNINLEQFLAEIKKIWPKFKCQQLWDHAITKCFWIQMMFRKYCFKIWSSITKSNDILLLTQSYV